MRACRFSGFVQRSSLTRTATGDYPTIQSAIDAAAVGDSVLLGAGVFTGPGNRDISFREVDILVASIAGDSDSSVIDCERLGRAFKFTLGESRARCHICGGEIRVSAT